jgi:hypothetical protein
MPVQNLGFGSFNPQVWNPWMPGSYGREGMADTQTWGGAPEGISDGDLRLMRDNWFKGIQGNMSGGLGSDPTTDAGLYSWYGKMAKVGMEGWDDMMAQRAQATQTNQNAYNEQVGGNYAGGVINDDYSKSTVPMPDLSGFQAPWQTGQWGVQNPMAFGQPKPSGQQQGGAMNSSSRSSWGGPFGNSNPWGAS